MVADHVLEGELNAILTSDLERIAERLDGSELAAALASPSAEPARTLYGQILAEIERIRAIARIEHQRALDVQPAALRPPVTAEEAYRFLGVNPKADEGMAKRLVDALRQNWHPDLARDEADRCEREDRIKRINAAWDLIRSR
jgi:DnaJ-domain-containing protein 1